MAAQPASVRQYDAFRVSWACVAQRIAIEIDFARYWTKKIPVQIPNFGNRPGAAPSALWETLAFTFGLFRFRAFGVLLFA